MLKFHLDDVGSAAELADPAVSASKRDEFLTAGDHLGAYVLKWMLYHST